MNTQYTRNINALDSFMVRFSRWFASPQSVVQVFVLTTLWSIIEVAFPHIDPNGFTFLYVCTVWSVQTQNVLAYASTLSAKEAEETQAMIVQLLQNNVHQLEALRDIIDKLHELERRDAQHIAEIADELEEQRGHE